MSATARPLCIVTGGSSGIGLELAKLAARDGHDLVIAADQPMEFAESAIRAEGAEVQCVQIDLGTAEGVDRLLEAVGHRPIAVLCANAGHGLGHAFLDQEWHRIRHMIDTNVTFTVYLLHKAARMMRNGGGRILVTGSIAGYTPQPYQAVYHGTKAFVDNFTIAFREEVKAHGIGVTLLMPGATETEFFDRAEMSDTKLGASGKDDPADVAKTGWDALKRGDADVVHGMMNKVATAMADVMPASVSASMAANQAKPGSGKKSA